MRKKTSKKRFLRQHARERAKQRYGAELCRQDLDRIVDKIQDGYAHFEEHRSNRIGVFRVELGDETFRVMYDRKRKCVATFLPIDS